MWAQYLILGEGGPPERVLQVSVRPQQKNEFLSSFPALQLRCHSPIYLLACLVERVWQLEGLAQVFFPIR